MDLFHNMHLIKCIFMYEVGLHRILSRVRQVVPQVIAEFPHDMYHVRCFTLLTLLEKKLEAKITNMMMAY